MCFCIFKGFSLSCYSTKLLLSRIASFTELCRWLHLKKIWQTLYLVNFKLPWRCTKYFIVRVRSKNMNTDNELLPKSCFFPKTLLSVNSIKWSNKLKQFVGKLPMNFLSVFDHFVGFALTELKLVTWTISITH